MKMLYFVNKENVVLLIL